MIMEDEEDTVRINEGIARTRRQSNGRYRKDGRSAARDGETIMARQPGLADSRKWIIWRANIWEIILGRDVLRRPKTR